MKAVYLITLAAIAPIMAAAAGAPLFTTSMAVDTVGSSERAVIKFEEVDRAATRSIVHVTGGPMVSGLFDRFMMLGMCGLAKARSEQYFQARQTSADPVIFEVSFPKTGSAAAASSSAPTAAVAQNVVAVCSCP